MSKKIYMGNAIKKLITFLIIIISSEISYSQAPVITSFSPVSATSFSQIKIMGTNLDSVTNVTFGGKPAEYFYSASDSLIIAYLDTVAYSGAVVVTTVSGTSSLPGFTFIPKPQIISILPNNGHYGDTIIMKGVNLSSVVSILFGNTPAFSFVIVSDSVIKVVVANGASGMIQIQYSGGFSYGPNFTYNGPSISSYTPYGGGAGTVVNISGLNFTGTDSVRFGTIPAASFTVVSNILIAATVGSGGVGDIIVHSPKGTASIGGFGIPKIDRFYPFAGGSRGSVETLFGKNFTGIKSVTFGGVPATSFVIASDTVIYATIGNGGSGTIVISNDSLSASIGNFNFTILYPTITSFTPSSGTKGTVITINGSHFTGATGVRFGQTPADSFKIVSDNVITATVARGSSGYVYVTNNVTDSMQGFTYTKAPPVITDFNPKIGAIGTYITIKGTGFNTNPEKNIVYFGAAKSTVTSSTDTSISLIVPVGTTFQPLSITVDSLTGFSQSPFDVTFQQSMASFTPSAFEAQLRLATKGSKPQNIAVGDFDNDGKVDIAVVYGYLGRNSNTVSVYKNISSPGYLKFSSPVEYTIGDQGASGFDIASSDIDGDGKLDLVILNIGANIVSILKNTSSNGSIAFLPKQDFTTGFENASVEGTAPNSFTINDFNGDGKPDIATANFGLDNYCKVSYLTNASTGNTISLVSGTAYPLVDAYTIGSADLNNDKKPDLVVGVNMNGSFAQQAISYKNTSVNKGISFQQNNYFGAVYPPNVAPYAIAFCDFDADGKPDVVTANGSTSSVSVFRNLSNTGGNIAFDKNIDLKASFAVRSASIGDMDGDGKPDILVSSSTANVATVLKNAGTAGNISFLPKSDFSVGNSPYTILNVDLDGDGKPEIITANSGDSSVSILRNRLGEPIAICTPSGSASITSDISGSVYQWQISIDSGTTFTNIDKSVFYSYSYTGVNTATLGFINLPDTLTGTVYRCMVNNNSYSGQYKVKFINTWLGIGNSLWDNPVNWSCGVVPDAYTDVVINSGNVVLNSDGVCKSLTVFPGVVFTANTGFQLTITK